MKKPISKYTKRILRAAMSQTNWGFTWDFTGANNETETREHKPSGHYSRVRVLLLAPCEQCGFLLGLLLHALWLLSTW